MEVNPAKHCYNCGKTFRTPNELLRHKNRKTPCLIREITEEAKNNPLRCIYCNTISSKKSHLERHLTTCKIKNGGLDKLHGKVKHEEQMRIMQEQHRLELQAIKDQMNSEREATAVALASIKEEMEKIKASGSSVAKVNNTINNTVNNTVVNTGPVTININSYTSPNADHLLTFGKFNEIFMKEFAGLPVSLVCNLYFDPSHPENMSLHLVNKSTGEMLTMCEGNWKTMSIDDVSAKIRAVGYEIAERGIKMHRKNFKFGDAEYVCGNILGNIHRPDTTERDIKEIKDKIVESREITGNAPHIAAKLTASRAVGRVRKVGAPAATTDIDVIMSSAVGDNIAE